ncbi:MAG: hypothetical protein AB1801_16170 [Chloroflexota bacterium]
MPDHYPAEFTIELATPADDPAIRRLLATNRVPGQIVTTYEREPDYFLGCGTLGRFCQVIIARHRPSGELAGLACRAVRPLYVNGRVEDVGYLSQLRVDRRFQGRWLVSRGFHYLHQLHADRRTSGYLATIIEGSAQASGVLVERPRRHFPTFRPIGCLWTMALVLRRPQPLPASPYDISHGAAPDLADIVAFLQQHGAAKHFFPVFSEADFGDSPTTRDFKPEDFILARRRGELVGVLGLWDQSSYKQTIVHRYGGALGRFRPLYNLGLRLMGARPLPAPGERIRYIFASFICTAENNPDIFDRLLRQAYNLAGTRGYAYLMVGLMAGDPLLAVARRYLHIPYHSRLYTVAWANEATWAAQLDERPLYLEVAAL